MQDRPLPKLKGHLSHRSSQKRLDTSIHVLQLCFTPLLCDWASLLQVSLLPAGISGSCLTVHSSFHLMHLPKSFHLLGTLCKHQHSKQQSSRLPFKRKQMVLLEKSINSSEAPDHLFFISLKPTYLTGWFQYQCSCPDLLYPCYRQWKTFFASHSCLLLLTCPLNLLPYTEDGKLISYICDLFEVCAVVDLTVSLMGHLASGIIKGVKFLVMFCSCLKIICMKHYISSTELLV